MTNLFFQKADLFVKNDFFLLSSAIVATLYVRVVRKLYDQFICQNKIILLLKKVKKINKMPVIIQQFPYKNTHFF